MGRIKIKDIPKDKKITEEELRTIFGGPTRRMEDFLGLMSDSFVDNFQQSINAQNLNLPLFKF